MLEIKATTPEIGAGTDELGNVMIHAIDRNAGLALTIVINSSSWKKVLDNFHRLKGVGIAVPGGLQIVPEQGIPGENGS